MRKITPATLVSDSDLESSSIVANNSMNRERELRGSNGYEAEIGFDAYEFLLTRVDGERTIRWLDLCCGTGRALVLAALLCFTRHLTSSNRGGSSRNP